MNHPDWMDYRVLKEIAEKIVDALIVITQESLESGIGQKMAKVMNKLDNGEPMVMIYLDFQKASDKVLHRKLLNKVGGGTDRVEEAGRLQKNLDRPGEWAKKWQIEFNAGKCEVMHFGGGPKKVLRMIRIMKNLSYEERLRTLGLYLMEFRRMRGHLIKTYRILRGLDKVDMEKMFHQQERPGPE
eukprot:g30781.t1